MNRMSCDEVQSSLVDYIEFELPISQRQQFNAHLTHCDQCRELHDDLQNVLVDAKSIEINEPGAQFWQELPNNVLTAVRQQRQNDARYTPVTDLAMTGMVETTSEFSDDGAVFRDKLGEISGENVLPFRARTERRPVNEMAGKKQPVRHVPATNAQPDNQRQAANTNKPLKPNHAFTTGVRQGTEQSTEQTPVVERFGEKPCSKFSWPKIALPIAASVLIAVSGVLLVNQSGVNNPGGMQFDNETPIFYDSVAAHEQISTGTAMSDKALAALAQTMVPISHQSARFGFTSQNAILNSFSIGALFTETIVYIKSEDSTLVKTHLALLGSAMYRQAGSKRLLQSIEMLKTDIQQDGDTVTNAFRLNQLMNQYAASLKSIADKEFVLFKLGAWSYDFALAALAKDVSLHHKVDEIIAFKAQLQQLGAPAGVTKSLQEINALITKEVMTDGDYRKTVEAVENIRSLLG